MASPNISDSSAPAPRIRVLCVDDNQGVRWVTRLVIDSEADMECVGCLESCERLVEEVRALRADVVLLDASMPGKDPLEAMGELATKSPQTKTLIYSGRDDQAFIDRVMTAGAWGYVSKNEEPESILRMVRDAVTRRA